MLVLAIGFAVGAGDVVTWLQAVGGVLLLPAWLVWTARWRPATLPPPVPAPAGPGPAASTTMAAASATAGDQALEPVAEP
jgi:hypothetical protein